MSYFKNSFFKRASRIIQKIVDSCGNGGPEENNGEGNGDNLENGPGDN